LEPVERRLVDQPELGILTQRKAGRLRSADVLREERRVTIRG
jgi:hypothetical protein